MQVGSNHGKRHLSVNAFFVFDVELELARSWGTIQGLVPGPILIGFSAHSGRAFHPLNLFWHDSVRNAALKSQNHSAIEIEQLATNSRILH